LKGSGSGDYTQWLAACPYWQIMRPLPAQVFHIADAVNWPSIERDGLLSTDAILRRSRFSPEIESAVRAHRPKAILLPNGAYVRDQAPMPPNALAACLEDGLSPREWYGLLNACVFFWIDPERLERHRHALRGRAQVLLTIDALALVAAYRDIAFVTPFNVGNARRKPARRSLRTLVPIDQWLANGWASEAVDGSRPRSRQHSPSELAVRGSIPDIMSYVTKVTV
jgi:hypothetical protein